MHELSLFGQVPLARHEQVLNILAGLAAMQPQPLYEKHTLLQPLSPSVPDQPAGKNAPKPATHTQSYTHLIQPLSPQEAAQQNHVEGQTSHDIFKVRTMETPEPETKAFVLRQVDERDVSGDEAQIYLDPARYRAVVSYCVEGQRLVCKDVVVISLYRCLLLPTGSEMQDGMAVAATTEHLTPSSLKGLDLLDPSGAFLLEATVRVEDRTKTALVQAATEALGRFRNEMRGSVDMRVPERLSLDTRVKENLVS